MNYRDYFSPKKEIEIPKAYVIPQGWWNIIDLLAINKIEYRKLERDTTIQVEVYRIKDYQTRKMAYEGHYQHYNTKVETKNESITLSKGDLIVPTNQRGIRYIIETLEPEALDSFFNWNFFDTVLQQKEGFSPYVWEDKAVELLAKNETLKAKFLEKKKDTSFAKNWYAQLDWIHKQSANYEKAHLRYPIYRILR